MYWRYRLAVFFFGILSAHIAAGSPHSSDEPMLVRYPLYVGDDPVFTRLVNYSVELLDLALHKSGRSYSLEAVPGEAVTDRRAERLLDNAVYDVNWMHSNPLREKALLPVYFPMFKGLAGWRLLLVDKADAQQFHENLTEAELQALRLGLGQDWPDVTYMEANHYTVVKSINRDSLVNMLLADRVDYLSRSVIEIWDELDYYRDKPLTLACCVAIQYPSAFYFFTSRNNPRLASILMEGLNNALQDGSFDALFNRYYGEALERANFSGRRIFRLVNPLMTEQAPLQRTELWYQP